MLLRSASLVIVVRVLVVSASELALTLIQASARSHSAGIAKVPNPETPLMYVAEGCDGSTAAMGHVVEILALHGIDGSFQHMGAEFLCPGTNPFYAESGNNMVKAVKLLNKDLRAHNKTLVSKSILHRDMDVTTSRALVNMGTLAVYVTRKNMLDQLVCMIRDCFLNTAPQSTVVGYPVHSNGDPSDMCFTRRKSKVVEKAWVRVSKTLHNGLNRSFLDEALEKLQNNVDTGYDQLKKAGYSRMTKIDSEDILAFEAGGKANLQTSLRAWTQLLQGWGIDAKTNELMQYLKSKASTWSEGGQRASIYNYDEVAAELKRLGRESLLSG